MRLRFVTYVCILLWWFGEVLARHPGVVGHRCERASHGLWKHGQWLCHWCCFHSWSFHRKERVLRWIFGKCSGWRCRRRHPHSARAYHQGSPVSWLRLTILGRSDAKHLPRVALSAQPARDSLQGHARYRVYHPTRQTLHVADSQWQANSSCCPADCRGHGQWRLDHQVASPSEFEARFDRPALTPYSGPQGQEGDHCQGPSCLSWCSGWQGFFDQNMTSLYLAMGWWDMWLYNWYYPAHPRVFLFYYVHLPCEILIWDVEFGFGTIMQWADEVRDMKVVSSAEACTSSCKASLQIWCDHHMTLMLVDVLICFFVSACFSDMAS